MLRLTLPPLRKPVRLEVTDTGRVVEPEAASEPALRRNLIDQIIALNPSASAEFLGQFEDAALARYLDHLNLAQQPRGSDARWIRPHGTPWAFAAAACA